MSLTGILLDVSGSMERNIGRGIDEEGGPWAESIFNVIDDLIEHDLTSENRVFALGVGADCRSKEIFDVIGTVEQIKKIMESIMKIPATEYHIYQVFDILEKNGARNIRKWFRDVTLIQETVSDYMATLILWKLRSDRDFRWKFVNDILPEGVRTTPHIETHRHGFLEQISITISKYQEDCYASGASWLRPATKEDVEEILKKTKPLILNGQRIPLKFCFVKNSFRISTQKSQERDRPLFSASDDASYYLTRESQERDHPLFSANDDASYHLTRESQERDNSLFSAHDAPYILSDVDTRSIFCAKDASRIIKGCLGEKKLSTERKQELLKNIEPFIYGGTPLYQSLEKAIWLFEGDTSETKLLFVLSDGEPADGSIDDIARINHITSKLNQENVKIVSCFITESTNIHPKRLYDEMQPSWEPGAKFLFSLSSQVPTQHLPRAILAKRGWTIDVANNETKLFIQVNHPDNLREACEMAKKVVCCSDVLSELLVFVHLDVYINRVTSGVRAKKQDELTCYAFASAVVLHLAMQRIHGREGKYPSFDDLKDEMIAEHGRKGALTSEVLQKICPKYRLRCRTVSDINGAKQAIVEKRPVVATFYLTDDQWDAFKNFYNTNPTGILTKNELNVRKRPTTPKGHAVVLTSYNSKCLIFMNSWGEEWADNGFFRVQNAEVLGDQLKFFDVYWELDDLTEKEREKYRKYGSELAKRLIEFLEGLEFASYTCPECEQTSLVTEFTGTLSKVQCPKCSREFPTSKKAGNILALNVYLTSLSR